MPLRLLNSTLLFFICISISGTASAASYFVKQDGHDGAAGTAPRVAFRTFTRAARALNHGDSIVLAPGTYKESVFLAERFGQTDQRIAITGDESGKLTGDKPGPVILESPNSQPALHAFRLKALTISGLSFHGPAEGLRLEQCHDAWIERCSADGCSRGIVAEGGEDIRVQSSVITRCTLGVYLKGVVKSRAAHLSVAGCTSAGIVLLSCGAGQIRNCILAQNNSNLVADPISASTWTCDFNAIVGDVGPWGEVPAIHNVYEWPSASRQDHHSVFVMPAFVAPDPYDLHISSTISWPGGLPGKEVGNPLPDNVTLDRDGRPLRISNGRVGVGAYDYPDAQTSGAWKKIGAITESVSRQSAGIYRADGSLVRTLLADAAGVREIFWDGLDDQGQSAPAGDYQLRIVTGDLRVVDDGNYADNGNPMGTYNPDNPERIVALDDGGFIVSVPYDEAGMPLRRFTATGQSIAASNLAQKDFMGLARHGGELIGVVNRAAPALARILPDCQRLPFQNGAESSPVFTGTEKPAAASGVAVIGDAAFIALPTTNALRVFDLPARKMRADWPVSYIKDVAAHASSLWVLSGGDVLSLDPLTGKEQKRFATGLPTPISLAASADKLAVVDRSAKRVVVLNAADGKTILQLGKEHVVGEWAPVRSDHLRDPRAAEFLNSGELALSEAGRIRLFDPATGKVTGDFQSNFMDTTVVHPADPQYLYNFGGIFRVDPKSGAWEWLVEAPMVKIPDPKNKGAEVVTTLGSPTHAVMLGGKPFIGYHSPNNARFMLFDVSNPLQPRQALHSPTNAVIPVWAYGTICFDTAGNMIGSSSGLQFNVADFKGLDDAGNPKFDFEHPRKLGPPKDPLPREMSQVGGLTADRKSGDLYYLAVTSRYNKMVPAWGADGTGVGRSTAAGDPLWFALSSGGNYMSVSAVNDGKQTFVLAGKSFGGQLDVFDTDGLRLTTGNWSWPTHYTIGFVDLRYGVHGYLRPDGKVGAYVEDDAIGRFARARLDGAETIRRQTTSINWQGSTEAATVPPLPDRTTGKSLARIATIPKVASLKVDGDWAQWISETGAVGVTPQVVVLPSNISFNRNAPGDLLQTFRQGTAIAAFAHDGENLYFYTLVTDDTMHFDATDSGVLWMYDGIELWIEEEQFGIAFTKDGKPALHKFRFHDRQGAEWKGAGPLPAENIWGQQLKDLSAHPLGKKLAAITGTSFDSKPGYALMAKIPMAEIKLVGGIAGRGKGVLPMTGKPDEVVRISVVIGGITASGREQDYKVVWPAGMMFSDPTRSYPFVLGK